MKLIVTGGGTGGHVFPALEAAIQARKDGWDVEYFGSLRGQERDAAGAISLPFRGFPSEPLYKLASGRGLRSAYRMLKAVMQCWPAIRSASPDVVFATGGYSSAPILYVAKRFNIPTVIHEQNSVPGRTLLMASQRAKAVCTVFQASSDRFPGARVVRTGMPVRQVFRDVKRDPAKMILVVGGSQGSAALNDIALSTAVHAQTRGFRWLHVAGKSHYKEARESAQKMGLSDSYSVVPFLNGQEIAAAMGQADVVVARSGAGVLSELAVVGVPSVLIPFPQSFGNHQMANAQEIASIGGATIIDQNELSVDSLDRGIADWVGKTEKQQHAAKALAAWDIPDATIRIMAMIKEAAAS